MEKDPCRGFVYLTVLCDRPYLVSVLFAVLLSLHLVTFLMLFITCKFLAWDKAAWLQTGMCMVVTLIYV